jgi:hypothetical protein
MPFNEFKSKMISEGIFRNIKNRDSRDPDEVSIEDVDPNFYAKSPANPYPTFAWSDQGHNDVDWNDTEDDAVDPFSHQRPDKKLPPSQIRDEDEAEMAYWKQTMDDLLKPLKFWREVEGMTSAEIARKIGHPGDQALMDYIDQHRPRKNEYR